MFVFICKLGRWFCRVDVQWASLLDNEGRVVDPKALKKRVFHGGIEPNLRPEVPILTISRFSFGNQVWRLLGLLDSRDS